MTPEEVQNEIKLIFARACAESLQGTADAILSIKDGDERKRAAEAHGAAFASAFIVVSRYFTGESDLSVFRESLAEPLEHKPLSSSTPEAGTQPASEALG